MSSIGARGKDFYVCMGLFVKICAHSIHIRITTIQVLFQDYLRLVHCNFCFSNQFLFLRNDTIGAIYCSER